MRWYSKLILAMCLLAVPSQVLALNAKNLRENETPVSARCVGVDGITFVGCGGGIANASAPTPIEGAAVGPSFDLANNLRVTLGTLISGEIQGSSQATSGIATGGMVVRQTTVAATVSTNTSSTPVTIPLGSKTFMGQLTCNAGGSTNCGITWALYGNWQNTNTNGDLLCTSVIPTGAAVTNGTCSPVTANYSFYYIVTTGVAGTSPSLTVYGMY